MDLEQDIEEIQASLADLESQLRSPRDLLHFHFLRGASATYQAALALLEPVKGMVGPEVKLRRAYLKGTADAWKRVGQLLRQLEKG